MKIPRRIVLSRKGFDSKYGGCASPILADGTLVSMPIREEGLPLRYRNINTVAGGCNLGDLVSKLKGCNVAPDSGVHLDPDLRQELHGRGNAPWRPMFGQCDAAERHLEKQGVDKNDLFLFFGWFRRVDQNLQFERSAHDEHVVWGWLQVDDYFDPADIVPEWAKQHPHCVNKQRKYNRVYVGRESLSFATSKPGAGTFAAYDSDLRLTHPDQARRRSQWRIPSFKVSSPITKQLNGFWMARTARSHRPKLAKSLYLTRLGGNRKCRSGSAAFFPTSRMARASESEIE
jgi:hypothetical protein